MKLQHSCIPLRNQRWREVVVDEAILKVGVVSIYPPKGSIHAESGGVASYTKNLVESLSLDNISDLIVFADKIDNKKEEYTEDKTRVIRCWDKILLYPLQLFISIFKERKDIDVFHIQHEYFLYGGALSAVLFPPLLFLIKILRKPTIVTMHGIIPFSGFGKEFMKQNNIKGNALFLKYGLWIITKLIYRGSDKIVVHEDYFRNILANDYGVDIEKIAVIPHGIEKRNDIIPKEKAKQILGVEDKNSLLFFGYIAGYKGIETLIDAFNYLDDKDYALFIAGGEHPRLRDDLDYQKYIKDLKDGAEKLSKNIIFTGFVPEEKIPLYFSATDLVVLPYTLEMSSSGPLAFSIAYNCPFLVSDALKESVTLNEIIFQRNPEDLANKIDLFFNSNDLKRKVVNYGKRLKCEWKWTTVGKKTYSMYGEIYYNRKVME